jgi:Na+-driven multidrug efflux pump
MQTPADIFHHSYNYIFVIFCGIPTVFLFNLLAGIMRALGDSKTPLNILIVSSVLHIVLDVGFVVGLGMGSEGVAYATVISQFVSGLLCWISLVRKFPILKMAKEDWKWRQALAATLCAMGIPMGLQYSVTAIGGVILQSAVNTLGSDAVAAVSAAVKVIVLFACPFDTLGNAMATYGGQNVGAGRLERLDMGLVACAKISVVYSILAMALLWIFGRELAALFIDKAETAILDGSALYLRVCSSFYITLAAVNVYRFLIQGMGFGLLSIFAGVAELFARAFAGIVLVPLFGFAGACFAGPLAWIFADAFLIPAYYHCKKKLKLQMNMT